MSGVESFFQFPKFHERITAMDKWDMNPLDRATAELSEKIAEKQKTLELLAWNRELIKRVMQACNVSTVCAGYGQVTLWIEQSDLPKARPIVGKLTLRAKQASGPNRLCVFLKSEQPEVGLAYYRPAPDPAHGRCKIVTEVKVESHTYHSLVCPQ
jgi:hypothetical protein